MGTRMKLNPVELKRQDLVRRLQMSTAEIGLTVRTTNCLDEQGISTVEDLLRCRRADLLAIANFGEKTLEEVYGALERLGFFRADRRPEDWSEIKSELSEESLSDATPPFLEEAE
ncbi:MAG: DNA-directed RNA polymerase subunit alpha C-terminal domain-containing protein [Planctomycetia bacterium]|nr:DNA-directed RNA polymerase subunit alpha C-terminal domain-containing protein [Planctomycetia bacterium]